MKDKLPGIYIIPKDWKPCCEDFKITMNMNHIKKGLTSFRFSGHHINYCPYCGSELEDSK